MVMEMAMAQNAYRGLGADSSHFAHHRHKKRILWVSHHKIADNQKDALRRYFGNDVFVDPDRRPYDDVAEILSRYRSGQYDDIVVVGPLSVKMKMVESGVEPIQAVKKRGIYVLERFRGAQIHSTPL